MAESEIALERPRADGTIGEMDTEGTNNDMSVLLITKKAGYGLARPKWHTTLEQIRRLPEVHVRPAT
jgi:hypothetical protein